jgi:GR25 family glycosyltransferase involved in LPS biosynthesis
MLMMQLNAYIIHVKGNQKRKAYMLQLIKEYSFINWHFIENGNISDLNTDILDTYFKGKMHNHAAFTSCAYKHLLALAKSNQSGWSLIVEDDITFYDGFQSKIVGILKEAETKYISNAIISLEDSIPKYIPKSERMPDQMLYPQNSMRLAGAYLIDAKAAQNALNYIYTHKSELTADWFYTSLIEKKVISCYWSQPPVACQKSLTGAMPSLIDNKKSGVLRQLNFGVQKWIKKLRSNFN